jgi:replicative DNA helicase
MAIEFNILNTLVHNEDFARKVIPFLKSEYFNEQSHKLLYKIVSEYFDTYNTLPTTTAIKIELDQTSSIAQPVFDATTNLIDELHSDNVDIEWLTDQTESFCQDRAIYNAIMKSIELLDKKGEKGEIPDLLQQALQVSFDQSVGHDFIEDSADRYDFYHQKQTKVPFDLEFLNKVTKGGLPNKTLNIVLAGTGVGKSLFMCHCAAANLVDGKNVLYITLEMAEERIAERIDANLLDATLDDLKTWPKETYEKKMNRLKDSTTGRLVIKEYPTASANSNHFRHLLQELRTKRNFKPDIIYIDYLNICSSSRIRGGINAGSYAIVKAIAEELRGLAVECNVPIVSATQTNRSGFSSSDIGLEDTSESFGLPATADFMVALSQTEELDGLNQYLVKQLKNRHSDPGFHRRFVIGVEKAKMRLYDVEQNAQQDIVDDTPIFDKSSFGKKDVKKLFEDFT